MMEEIELWRQGKGLSFSLSLLWNTREDKFVRPTVLRSLLGMNYHFYDHRRHAIRVTRGSIIWPEPRSMPSTCIKQLVVGATQKQLWTYLRYGVYLPKRAEAVPGLFVDQENAQANAHQFYQS